MPSFVLGYFYNPLFPHSDVVAGFYKPSLDEILLAVSNQCKSSSVAVSVNTRVVQFMCSNLNISVRSACRRLCRQRMVVSGAQKTFDLAAIRGFSP